MRAVRSHGDMIRSGRYSLHSAFPSAANFRSGEEFVFVVGEEIGAGPLSIVLEGTGVAPAESLEVDTESFRLDGERYGFRDSPLYDSALSVRSGGPGWDPERFGRNLMLFRRELLRQSHPKSLAFLLDRTRERFFTSAYEVQYVRRFLSARQRILSGDLPGSIRMIRGLGPGLTPSGDDCIAGILIALNLRQLLSGRDLSGTIGHIVRIAEGRNGFTNALLGCAAAGRVPEAYQHLIGDLLYSGGKDVSGSTAEVLRSGETSGADEAVGFLMGLGRTTVWA